MNVYVTGPNVVERATVGATFESAGLPAANLAGPLYRPYRSGPVAGGHVDLYVDFPMNEPEDVGFVGLLDVTLNEGDRIEGFGYGPTLFQCAGSGFGNLEHDKATPTSGTYQVHLNRIEFNNFTGVIRPKPGVFDLGLTGQTSALLIEAEGPYGGFFGIVGAIASPTGQGFVLNGSPGLVLSNYSGTVRGLWWRSRVALFESRTVGPFGVTDRAGVTRRVAESLPRHVFFRVNPAPMTLIWLRIHTTRESFDIGGLHVACVWDAPEGREAVTLGVEDPNKYKVLPSGLKVRVGPERRRLRKASFDMVPMDWAGQVEGQILLDVLAGEGSPVCVSLFPDGPAGLQRYGEFLAHLTPDEVKENAPGWQQRRVRLVETTGGAR